MRKELVAKLQKARQDYIEIYTTDHTQARKLNLCYAGHKCMQFRLELHNLDARNEQ